MNVHEREHDALIGWESSNALLDPGVQLAPLDVLLRPLGVVDQGRGMDDAEAARAGEPFFSTKPAGAGLGLGLFLVVNVLRKLGGEAASILIDVYESQGAFAQLAAALDVSVRFTSDSAERVALLTRAAEVRRSRLGDAAGAFTAYAHAFEATPDEVLGFFLEDRRAHLKDVVLPALERGEIVVCDRYKHSTLAYQAAQGIEREIQSKSCVAKPVPVTM